jgi:hypothetical protein
VATVTAVDDVLLDIAVDLGRSAAQRQRSWS